jgi:hypothetical protein
MKQLFLLFAFLFARTVVAQQMTVPVDVSFPDDKSLVLTWESNSNELYHVSFRTNLVQTQAVTLKSDIFATSPTNRLSVHRGLVPSAYFQVEVQAVLGDTLPYEILYPGLAYFDPVTSNLVTSGEPTFIGTFCVTNDLQFEEMKEELGLAGKTFDFSSEVLIGIMAPETSSIGGHYRMDYVRETANEILVCYNYLDYYPLCSPAFHKEVFVVRTEHRNKPVRLAFRGSFLTNGKPSLFAPLLSIDPESAYPALTWPIDLP